MIQSDFMRLVRATVVTIALLLPAWLGAQNVTLDLKGYRTGSMNETLDAETLAQGQNK